MPPATRKFSLADQPEVFPTSAEISAALQRTVKSGKARKLAGRLYTKNLADPLEQVALRNWQTIANHYFPGAVIVDRSAFEAKPSADGSLFLDAGPSYAGRRTAKLPGLRLRPRKGPGPVTGDMPYMGLHFSSRERTLLDNMRRSRARNGMARTYSQAEMENEIIRIVNLRGPDAINELRDKARAIAQALNAEQEMQNLDDLVGAVLGTRNTTLETSAARARREGISFDKDRIDLFAALQSELLRDEFPERSAGPGPTQVLSFFEAYFSNWIEGTGFELDEAEEIVFERRIPEERSEDAHDVLGTFDLINDPLKRRQLPSTAEDLFDILRTHHAQMLERRPGANPGAFKSRPNHAGATTFVDPELVIGTLIEGFRFFEALPAGLPSAIFLMFLISEVHPFKDGNGRVGRVLMNAALSKAGQQRIVIPLTYRDDYLGGLRALSRTGNSRPLIRVLDFAQRYATGIQWNDQAIAQSTLESTNAFVPPDEAEASGRRLRLPPGVMA